MDFRSTNTKYVHFSGDVVSNVDDGSSYGVHITGGSTGGVIQAAGDTTNIGLVVRGKGTGAVRLGNSSSPTQIGASTTSIVLAQRYFVEYTIPALSSGPAASESTVTVTGLTTNSVLILQNRLINNSTGQVSINARCSTADELTIQFVNNSASSLSGSTQSAYLFQLSF